MANTTFSGPVRSESTLKTVSKNSSTGAITEVTTLGDGPVSLSDGDVTLTNATHSGRVLLHTPLFPETSGMFFQQHLISTKLRLSKC